MIELLDYVNNIDPDEALTLDEFYELQQKVLVTASRLYEVEVVLPKCGHKQIIEIRLDRDLESIIDKNGKYICDVCSKERNDFYSSTAKESGLPPLQGSHRQVNWAESIRVRAMKKHGELIKHHLENEDNSRFWIENRNFLSRNKLPEELL